MEDVKEECSKFGTVKSVEIPRPRAGQDVTGVGKVFVEFMDLEGCNKGTRLYNIIIIIWKLNKKINNHQNYEKNYKDFENFINVINSQPKLENLFNI